MKLAQLCSVMIMCLVLTGCFMKPEEFDDFAVVVQYIGDENGFTVEIGPYKDGTAILSGEGAAFWVKDGVGYTVNVKAETAAPDLDPAPAGITFSDEFVEAAQTQ